MKSREWIACSKKHPCPICQHDSWCAYHVSGEVIYCMRVESSNARKGGGWIHRLTDPVPVAKPRVKAKPEPVRDFTAYACECADRMIQVDKLAAELGVSERSLERLQVGWNGHPVFPMRDDFEKIIGMRIRDQGRQWSVPGSHNGLFWPEGLDYSTLFFCEGPTDCAALLTLDCNAIGRPSCSGGVDFICGVIRRKPVRDVVIMADRDDPKTRPDGTQWYPGEDGAYRLAQTIQGMVSSVKVILPPHHKDIRAWLQAGATRGMLDSMIRSTLVA